MRLDLRWPYCRAEPARFKWFAVVTMRLLNRACRIRRQRQRIRWPARGPFHGRPLGGSVRRRVTNLAALHEADSLLSVTAVDPHWCHPGAPGVKSNAVIRGARHDH